MGFNNLNKKLDEQKLMLKKFNVMSNVLLDINDTLGMGPTKENSEVREELMSETTKNLSNIKQQFNIDNKISTNNALKVIHFDSLINDQNIDMGSIKEKTSKLEKEKRNFVQLEVN